MWQFVSGFCMFLDFLVLLCKALYILCWPSYLVQHVHKSLYPTALYFVECFVLCFYFLFPLPFFLFPFPGAGKFLKVGIVVSLT